MLNFYTGILEVMLPAIYIHIEPSLLINYQQMFWIKVYQLFATANSETPDVIQKYIMERP